MAPAQLFHVLPSTGVPIYRQLMDQVRALAASGRLTAGEFLPSVRHVAEDLSINPMTVSKAWSLLERDGVVETVRGQGMRLKTPAAGGSAAQRLTKLDPLLGQVAANAHQLGLDADTVIERLKTHFVEEQ